MGFSGITCYASRKMSFFFIQWFKMWSGLFIVPCQVTSFPRDPSPFVMGPMETPERNGCIYIYILYIYISIYLNIYIYICIYIYIFR